MRIDAYKVLSRAVMDGLEFASRRAFKHRDPEEEPFDDRDLRILLTNECHDLVMNEIVDVIDFDSSGCCGTVALRGDTEPPMRIEWNLYPNYGGPGKVYIPSGLFGVRSDVPEFSAANYPPGTKLIVQDDSLGQEMYEVREDQTETGVVRKWYDLDGKIGAVDMIQFSAHVADAPVRLVLDATTE